MRACRLANRAAAASIAVALLPYVAPAQGVGRPVLRAADVDAIARLEMLEDQRRFDSTALSNLLASAHPEVRRRAALTVGRIADKRGMALLRALPSERDTAVLATVVFAAGQLKDTSTVAWFDSVLFARGVAPTVATEAASALGKLKTAAARASLARFLSTARATATTNETIGEALLSIGRSTARGDLAPIIRWAASPNEEIRWRATWALFRQRDPAAVQTLLMLSSDRSAHVRSWAVRGLARPQADSANLGDKAEQRLIAAARDSDRRVRTESIRALGSYSDSAAIRVLVSAVASADAWIAVSAAEGLARVRGAESVRALVAASERSGSCAVRATAMQSLQAFSRQDAANVAQAMTRDTNSYCRSLAWQAVVRDTSRSLADRRADLAATDSIRRFAALRAWGTWADTSELAAMFEVYERAQSIEPTAASAVAASIGTVQNRRGAGASQFLARFSAPDNPTLRRDVERALGAPARTAWGARQQAERGLDEYRAIVERWVVPAYNGKPNPVAHWETPRGAIEVELYAGETPLAVDYFVQTVESGNVVGTEFTRVVPDFVDQQATIRNGRVLRDEVNRHRLTRGNLAWASAGLDTGSPGYTLNHTPQPHNEGDFTSMGRVVVGMDVVDRIELGDRATAARLVRR